MRPQALHRTRLFLQHLDAEPELEPRPAVNFQTYQLLLQPNLERPLLLQQVVL